MIDAVKWIPSAMFYEVRGGPLAEPFVMPDSFEEARRALTDRFPEARAGIRQLLGEMEHLAASAATVSAVAEPMWWTWSSALGRPAMNDWSGSVVVTA